MPHTLFRIIKLLERERFPFLLGRKKQDTVSITATVRGEPLAIEIYEDGHVEYSRMGNLGAIEGNEPQLISLISQQRHGGHRTPAA